MSPLAGRILAHFYLFPDRSLTQGDLALKTNMSQASVSRALAALAEQGAIVREGSGGRDGYVYRLPHGGIGGMFENALKALQIRNIRFQNALQGWVSEMDRIVCESSSSISSKEDIPTFFEEARQLQEVLSQMLKLTDRSKRAVQYALDYLERNPE